MKPNHNLSEESSDSGDDSEYIYADWSESDTEYSCDSGVGLSNSQNKDIILSKTPVDHDSPFISAPLADFDEKELKTANYFADWLKAVADPDKDIVKEIQDKIQNFPDCKSAKEYSGHRPVLRLVGETDSWRNAHGDVEIYYVSGDHFCGTFNHGRKIGLGVESYKNGDTFTGIFKNGHLDGFVRETLEDNITREVFYRNGVKHGFYREFGHSKQFLAFGRFENGKKVGSHWCWSRGDSYLVGSVDENNKPDGKNIFFLYQDLATTLCGDFTH